MAKMNEEELLLYRNAAEANSIHSSDELNASNRKAFDYYSGKPLGNEVKGESKVISTDVFDLVEADMPSLVRVFLGANDIMRFSPVNDSPREREIAEEKTKYINQLVRNQPDSYKTIFDWLKGAEIYKYSAANFGYEIEETVKVKEWEGLSNDELDLINIDLQLLEEAGAEIDIDQERQKDKTINVKATIKKEVGRYFVRYVNPEDFVITRGATSVDDAETVGHDQYLTKSDLIALGYDKDIVRQLPTINKSSSVNRENRLDDQGGAADGNSSNWTGEIVRYETRYLKVDKDGDGIAERLEVITVGDNVLSDEPYEIAPYALLSAVMIPGQAIGMSRADVAMETQDIKSTLLRQTMMNMYQVNAARMAVNKNVNKDDLLTTRLGGIVRVNGAEPPLNSIAPLPVPFIADKALMVVQYADAARAQRTGSLLANQALDTDKLGQETATRFTGVENAANAKIELIARGYAETGFKHLFLGMLWTVSHFQKEATEIMVLGKPLTVDPRRWITDQPIVCNVGLGAGDDETMLQNMNALLLISQQLSANGSPLTDMSKQYNILSRVVKAMNQSDVGEFFNDPTVPTEVLQAQVEQLQLQNFQLQQQVQQNPLAEAETIKARAGLVEAQAKQQLDIAKLAEDNRQFNEKLQASVNEALANLEFKYTQLEVDSSKDIPGSRV